MLLSMSSFNNHLKSLWAKTLIAFCYLSNQMQVPFLICHNFWNLNSFFKLMSPCFLTWIPWQPGRPRCLDFNLCSCYPFLLQNPTPCLFISANCIHLSRHSLGPMLFMNLTGYHRPLFLLSTQSVALSQPLLNYLLPCEVFCINILCPYTPSL